MYTLTLVMDTLHNGFPPQHSSSKLVFEAGEPFFEGWGAETKLVGTAVSPCSNMPHIPLYNLPTSLHVPRDPSVKIHIY